MLNCFSVTYEIVTIDSAEFGEVVEEGYIGDEMSLRDAINELFSTFSPYVDGIDGINPSEAQITVAHGIDFEDGYQESRSLHIPDHITPASRTRLIKRLCKRGKK